MSAQLATAESLDRGARMLRTAMGCELAGWLADPDISEVMLNADGVCGSTG